MGREVTAKENTRKVACEMILMVHSFESQTINPGKR